MRIQTLMSFELRQKEFNRILKEFECFTEYSADLYKYKIGYKDKQIIYYNETQLICTESHLRYLGLLENLNIPYTHWKQVIINCNNETTNNYVEQSITGLSAWCLVHKALNKYYSKDEIKAILSSYKDEYDPSLIQLHELNIAPGLSRYDNCVYYDINGAHCYELSKMFPKAKDYFETLYNERHSNPRNKLIANAFVGMLNTKNNDTGNFNRYPCAYNHIIQSVTKQLNSAVSELMGNEGTVIYENTDGVIIQAPEAAFPTSNKLGEFKIEAQGTVYTYRDTNYWCIQYRDMKGNKVIKGNLLNSVRELIDLEQGKVVHYTRLKNEFNQFVAIDIKQEVIKND